MPKKTQINVSKKDLVYLMNGLHKNKIHQNFTCYENDYIFHENHNQNLFTKLHEVFEML